MAKQYVAIKPLFIGRHRAHGVGAVLDQETVERNGWQAGVKPAGTKAAAEAPGVFDPSEHSYQDVLKHLEDADDTERDRVLALEYAGKARVSIIGKPDSPEDPPE